MFDLLQRWHRAVGEWRGGGGWVAEISGVGSVEYIGDPTIKQDVIGAGRVSKHQ
jgi:hypothetical protein